jgi:hypothetical protein
MATQGQRRAEGRSAIRKLRQEYRKVDTAGEKVERELDRLVKRKTLITPDQLRTASDRLVDYVKAAESLQRLYATVMEIVRRLPS